MTTPHPLPHRARSGSVLDGDPRILIPLPEAAERLGISRWQAYKLARSGRLPTTRLGARDLHVPAAVLRRIEQEGLPPRAGGERGRVTRRDPLAAHIRRLGNHDLQRAAGPAPQAHLRRPGRGRPGPAGPAGRAAAAVRAGPRRGWLDGGGLRAPPAAGHPHPRPRPGRPGGVAGLDPGRRPGPGRRTSAGGGVVGMRPRPWPGSPRRVGPAVMALAAHVRGLPDPELHELLRALPRERVRPAAGGRLRLRGDGRMTAAKRCPRCGQVKPAERVLPPPADPAVVLLPVLPAAAARLARRRRRQDPAAVEQLRAVDRARQRRHRALGGQGGAGR